MPVGLSSFHARLGPSGCHDRASVAPKLHGIVWDDALQSLLSTLIRCGCAHEDCPRRDHSDDAGCRSFRPSVLVRCCGPLCVHYRTTAHCHRRWPCGDSVGPSVGGHNTPRHKSCSSSPTILDVLPSSPTLPFFRFFFFFFFFSPSFSSSKQLLLRPRYHLILSLPRAPLASQSSQKIVVAAARHSSAAVELRPSCQPWPHPPVTSREGTLRRT
jgi:hypothetical protein